MRRFKKMITGVVVIVGLILIGVAMLAMPVLDGRKIKFGVTFSQPHASGIGLDWKKTFTALLDDLGVRELRLVAYWSAIEPADDEFDFTALDWQMDEAVKRGAKVVLAVGRKVPRWPECHEPAWAGGLPEREKQSEVLQMLSTIILRYKDHPALVMWQLENEPFLDFGICPPGDADFLWQEEQLVKLKDSRHPILITDSGELNWWLKAATYGDQVGTTMYRTVFSERTEDYFHYDYLFPAWLYRLKARLVGLVNGKEVLVAELQGEPWGVRPFTQLSREERQESLTPGRLQEIADFAQRVGLTPVYWWGAEYWYWEKEVNGEPVFWEEARSFF